MIKTASIKLERKNVVIPDNSLQLHVKYMDLANPLTDESGNTIYTSEVDDAGNLIPEYPEYTIDIDIPEDSTPSADLITSLISQALDSAKIKAQNHANKEEKKKALKPYVENVATLTPVEFEGTVDLTGITVE